MSTVTYAEALRSTPLLQGLPDKLILHIEDHVAPWPACRNRLLFFKGDPEDFIAFVHRGHIYHTLHEPGGREIILDYTLAGGIVGESALLHPRRRSFNAQLSADCQVSLLRARHFAELQADAVFMQRIHQQLCSRLQQLSDFVESACLYRLEARVARHLLTRMEGADQPEVRLPGNQSILAAMLNVSRPRLNSLLQRWQREGLIRPQAHMLRIDNPERLRHIAAAQ
ncbi:Crp/Fnr family transcriptional regulator [Paraburkholderia sp. SARCC-3016]|uniref:Crp/Fnr family transcriptional regulator n=1 Tax=Paraburkholderia sp. SARCC-3016 TaxID=3058611 RepID=UPI002808C0BA|nr:Crp/Fnr family transcriptional regulator [Paraburkholderia sp. SARCC-3016]MDQ7982407.1 Crp/Fnr family transcriptional regulator [Paraburkholderia sp. SARCC-3016]